MTFEQAREQINDVVKANGVGAITGTNLNGVLNDMLTAVEDELEAIDTALRAIIG